MPAELGSEVILTKDQCAGLFATVLDAAKASGVRDVEAIFGAHREALTRFANNTIHQNVSEQAEMVSVRVQLDGKTARATTNRLDDASLRAAVAEAIRLVEGAGQTAAGIYSTGHSIEALFNSQGIAAWHAETMANFSITAMAGNSSGWAKGSAVARAAMDPVAMARTASDKARN